MVGERWNDGWQPWHGLEGVKRFIWTEIKAPRLAFASIILWHRKWGKILIYHKTTNVPIAFLPLIPNKNIFKQIHKLLIDFSSLHIISLYKIIISIIINHGCYQNKWYSLYLLLSPMLPHSPARFCLIRNILICKCIYILIYSWYICIYTVYYNLFHRKRLFKLIFIYSFIYFLNTFLIFTKPLKIESSRCENSFRYHKYLILIWIKSIEIQVERRKSR